ncbi:MAG: SixA phosphatase family protein [Sphingomonadales bacterium]
MKKIIIGLSVIFLILVGSAFPVFAYDGTTIYLVRHAEKITDGSRDPALTKIGKERSKGIANILHDKNLTHIFSTPFIRTRDTAAPTAHEHQLEIKNYDPMDSQGLVDKLKTLEGTILVTGHSNTTTGLVNLLTGSNLENLVEAIQYDMVYIVTLGDNGHTELEIIHSEPRTPLQ